MSTVGTFFLRCPSCGRRFGAKLVTKAEVDDIDEKETRKQTERFVRGIAYQTGHTSSEVSEMTDTKEFRYSYKCKHCGHEWTVERYESTSGPVDADYEGD
jgi:transposase-like protein